MHWSPILAWVLPRRALIPISEPPRMHRSRLTLGPVCAIATLTVAAACAGHVAPPTHAGAIKPSTNAKATTAAVSTPNAPAPSAVVSALTKGSPVPASVRALPKALLVDVQLNQAISSTTPTGFAFSTKVAEPVTAKDGAVAIPAGTVIRGVVTGVRAGTATKPAVICLNLDFMELAGREYGIRSSVKDVLVNDKPATIFPRDSIAAIFPNDPAGQFEGTAIAFVAASTADTTPLPVGATLVVRLDSAITVLR